MFWTKGFEATSIADLIEATGIGAPSLYAAFHSKEALYAEALRFYAETQEGKVWTGFRTAVTAREAVRRYLMDSSVSLTAESGGAGRGCMVTLSSVDSEGHAELGALVRTARAETFKRLTARLARAVEEGEVPASTDLDALARFIQTVQNGMSILARDGANCAELEAVAEIAMAGWDARITPTVPPSNETETNAISRRSS